jgi:hypothetical protein
MVVAVKMILAGAHAGRKRRMTPGKVESARKLLKGGMPPRDVAQSLRSRSRRSTAGSPLQVDELSVRPGDSETPR